MGNDTFYITRQSATGVFGYQLLLSQNIICSNSNLVLPDPQSARSKDLRTNKEYIIYPMPIDKHPTIIPGLKIRYGIFDEANNENAVFEKVYDDIFHVKINVYVDNKIVLVYSPHPDLKFVSPENKLIACVEEDFTFKYNSRSIDDKRFAFQMNDEYFDLIPYIFHAFISDKLGVL